MTCFHYRKTVFKNWTAQFWLLAHCFQMIKQWSSAHRLWHEFFISSRRILSKWRSKHWLNHSWQNTTTQHAYEWKERLYFPLLCHGFCICDSSDSHRVPSEGSKRLHRPQWTSEKYNSDFNLSIFLFLFAFWLIMWQLPLISFLNLRSIISFIYTELQH